MWYGRDDLVQVRILACLRSRPSFLTLSAASLFNPLPAPPLSSSFVHSAVLFLLFLSRRYPQKFSRRNGSLRPALLSPLIFYPEASRIFLQRFLNRISRKAMFFLQLATLTDSLAASS